MGTDMKFTKRPEVIFIEYNEVIKSPTLFMLKMIRDRYIDTYKDFIDVDIIKNMSDEELEIYMLRRENNNIFYDLKKTEFDVFKSYMDLYYKFDDMYVQSPLLQIGETIDYLAGHKFTDSIYFYTERYDPRIEIDIRSSFKSLNKLHYAHGPIHEVLKEIKQPTTYILHDLLTASHVIHLKKANLTDIMVAQYKYNLSYNEEADELVPYIDLEELTKEHVFKFALFMPYSITDKHAELLPTISNKE